MFKRLATLGIVLALTVGHSTSYASAPYAITLDSAIEKAIEKNANIRLINNKIPAIEEGLRKASEGSNRIQELYDAYDTYRIMYYDSEDTFDDFIDMEADEQMQEISDLSMRIANNRNPVKIKQLMDDIKFITYSLMFNGEEPNLTDAELYHRYGKSIGTLKIQAQNEYDKTINNIDLIKGNVTVGLTKLYIGALDLESGIETQFELLKLRQSILEELVVMHEEGLISEFDLYKNSMEVDKLKLEIDKMQHQLNGLHYSLNNMLALDIESELYLSKVTQASHYKSGAPIASYVDMAIQNSPVLESMRIDLKYYEDNLELYNSFSGYDFGAEFEELTYQIEKNSSEIQEAQWNLETNLNYAIGDILALEEVVNKNEIGLKNAKDQLDQVVRQKELGLVKQTDVHTAKLGYQVAKMTLTQSHRALDSGLIKFNMLVDYGIEYQ